MKTVNNFDKCIILHGCPPNSENVIPKSKRWMNWLEDKLKEKGFYAFAPDMPAPWQPLYEEWKRVFEKNLPTANSVLVGHSCGAAFLVRWLLETKTCVKKLILVAPAKLPESKTDTRFDLFNFKLPSDASYIANEIVIFISDDFEHHMKSFELYKKALRPRVIKLKNKGHFLIYTMGTNEFPELLKEIIPPSSRMKITTTAHLTCPTCNAVQSAEMSLDACQHFFKCQICGEMLKPKVGDCCVFCSYADTQCPPKQKEFA